MDVGVRELEQQLSRYPDEVERGAEVIVTDRGRPKARIIPIVDEGHLHRGIEEGWIRPALRTGPIVPRQRARAARRSGDVLDEDRA